MKTLIWMVLVFVCLTSTPAAQATRHAPNVLPESAAALLADSLDAASHHAQHIWRDTPPMTDGVVNAFIEIPRGDRRKWEFDMRTNALELDRVMPEDLGGYPVNYGFVPQTVSYDGDPFDVLVLGPPLPAARVVRGAVVGLMLMEDEKGIDSKVVVSPIGSDGHPPHELGEAEQERIADYFRRYKRHEPDKFSRVRGWGSAADGRAHIAMTHAFFRQCRAERHAPCRVDR